MSVLSDLPVAEKLDHVAATLAAWLAEQSGIQAAYTQAQLMGEIPTNDVIGQRVKKSFDPTRSGDVLTVVKPYYMILSQKTGTTHGTPHPFDTHVPLILYGAGVKAGKHADAVTPQAMAASLATALGVPIPAKAEAPVTDMFWGDRYGRLKDPFGHSWSVATHKEDVSPAEMQKRMKEAMAKMSQQHSKSAH